MPSASSSIAIPTALTNGGVLVNTTAEEVSIAQFVVSDVLDAGCLMLTLKVVFTRGSSQLGMKVRAKHGSNFVLNPTIFAIKVELS